MSSAPWVRSRLTRWVAFIFGGESRCALNRGGRSLLAIAPPLPFHGPAQPVLERRLRHPPQRASRLLDVDVTAPNLVDVPLIAVLGAHLGSDEARQRLGQLVDAGLHAGPDVEYLAQGAL